jgi:predicted RNA-binding protein with PUA domain
MCFLNWLKRTIPLTSEMLNYIHNYQSILRKVIKEAKKSENDKLVILSKNKIKLYGSV